MLHELYIAVEKKKKKVDLAQSILFLWFSIFLVFFLPPHIPIQKHHQKIYNVQE